VVNRSGSGVNVQVALYNDAGNPQDSKLVFLPPHGKLNADLADLFSLTMPTSGYLVLNPQSLVPISGSITFGDATTGEFTSSLPLQSAPSNKLMMCHIANGTLGSVSYYTGLAVLNPNAGTHTARVTAYNESGLPIGSRTIGIPGRARVVSMLDGFIPGLTQIFGGYVVVEDLSASGGLLAFQLFGDWSFQFLSAVPAIPMN
jgi:hypothetical protein